VGADQIKIEIDVETRAAIRDLSKVASGIKDVEKETKRLSSAQQAWKLLNTDVGKLGDVLSATHPKLVGFASTLGNVTKGVIAGAGALAGAGYAFTQLTASIEQQDRVYRRLGAAYNEVATQTNGVITAQQALTLRGQLAQAGFEVQARQLGLLARAARDYAEATGNDANEAIEKLTNAIVNNSADALSELNLSNARATTSTQTLANVTRELERRFRDAAPAARTLQQDLDKLPQTFSALTSELLKAAELPFDTISRGFLRIGGALAGIDTNGMTMRSAIREIANYGDDRQALDQQARSNAAGTNRRVAREQLLQQLQRRGMTMDLHSLGGVNRLSEQEASLLTSAVMSARSQAHLDDFVSQMPSIRSDVDRQAARRAGTTHAGEAAVSEDVRRKEQIAKRLANATDGVSNAFERAAKRIEISGTAVIDIVGAAARASGGGGFSNRFQTAGSALGLTSGTDAEQADLFGGIADSVEGGGATNRAERSRRSRIAARDRETRRQAREQSPLGRFGALFGIERDDGGNIKPLDGLQTGLSFAQSALPTLTSGFAELWTSIADGSATAGDAFAAFGAKALSTLGNVAIQEGSAMLLKAIPAMIEAPPLGAAYLAGGAGLIALGVGLGAAGAAAKPKPAAASSASSDANAARGMRSGSLTSGSKGGLGSTTVVLGSLVPAGIVDAVNARNGLRQVRRSGLDDGTRAPRKIDY
jgi:hypothetical protein